MVATDGSDGAKLAVNVAADLAKAFQERHWRGAGKPFDASPHRG